MINTLWSQAKAVCRLFFAIRLQRSFPVHLHQTLQDAWKKEKSIDKVGKRKENSLFFCYFPYRLINWLFFKCQDWLEYWRSADAFYLGSMHAVRLASVSDVRPYISMSAVHIAIVSATQTVQSSIRFGWKSIYTLSESHKRNVQFRAWQI